MPRGRFAGLSVLVSDVMAPRSREPSAGNECRAIYISHRTFLRQRFRQELVSNVVDPVKLGHSTRQSLFAARSRRLAQTRLIGHSSRA